MTIRRRSRALGKGFAVVVAVAVGLPLVGCGGAGPSPTPAPAASRDEPPATAGTRPAVGPIGQPDEMIVVSTVPDGPPPTLLVELVGAGGARRSIARLPAFGRLPGDVHDSATGFEPVASHRGLLAVLTDPLEDPNEPRPCSSSI